MIVIYCLYLRFLIPHRLTLWLLTRVSDGVSTLSIKIKSRIPRRAKVISRAVGTCLRPELTILCRICSAVAGLLESTCLATSSISCCLLRPMYYIDRSYYINVGVMGNNSNYSSATICSEETKSISQTSLSQNRSAMISSPLIRPKDSLPKPAIIESYDSLSMAS